MNDGSAVLPAERPSVSIGHDLYWWRHDDAGLRTAVSVYWPRGWEHARLLAVLRWFDEQGTQVADHEVWLSADRLLSIDSSSPPVPLPMAGDGVDGVLSIELFADVDTAECPDPVVQRHDLACRLLAASP